MLERAQRKTSELDGKLADPALYEAGRVDEMKGLMQEKARLQAQIEEAELAWLEASEKLEAAESA